MWMGSGSAAECTPTSDVASVAALGGGGCARGADQSERTSASALMIIFFDIGAVIAPLALAQATAFGGAIAYFIVQALPQALLLYHNREIADHKVLQVCR
jgi:hypothetical protein